MAMSGMGMMAGMAAGQALVSALMGGGSGAVGGMMGAGMLGRGMKGAASMGGSSILSGLLGNSGSGMGRGGMGMRGGRGMNGQGSQAGDFGSGSTEVLQQVVGARPQQTRSFELISKLPGRRRYRAMTLTEELAQLLQEKLQQLSFLQEVQVNAATGSLLFLFPQDEQAEEQMDKLAAFLQERIFRPLPRLRLDDGLSLEAHAGLLTKSIRGTVRDFSAWIKSHTGGWLDVSSVASIFFLCKGLQQMLAAQQLPSGSQMFWWAVSLMRGWRTV